MRIKIPKFVRKMICNHISKSIEEETGIRTDIDVGIMTLDTNGRNYTLYMAESISVSKSDLKRFIKENMKKES